MVAKFGEPREGERGCCFPANTRACRTTFRNLGIGLILATLLTYFLMVALFKSYITPLVVLSACWPVCLLTTLLVVPSVYALAVRDEPSEQDEHGGAMAPAGHHG